MKKKSRMSPRNNYQGAMVRSLRLGEGSLKIGKENEKLLKKKLKDLYLINK